MIVGRHLLDAVLVPRPKAANDPQQSSDLGAKVAQSMTDHLFLLSIEVSP
jgi:hypothetical protein